jgi:hypothetical protein
VLGSDTTGRTKKTKNLVDELEKDNTNWKKMTGELKLIAQIDSSWSDWCKCFQTIRSSFNSFVKKQNNNKTREDSNVLSSSSHTIVCICDGV